MDEPIQDKSQKTARPKVSSEGQKELDKAEIKFQEFEEEVKSMTFDQLNLAPRTETEGQTKLSTKEIQNAKDIYLKPWKTVSSNEKFNEKYRSQYEFMKTYVPFIAENNEVVGEAIDLWTKPFAGMPAEEWKVPVNKPIWGPRYLAEQIKRKYYHRLTMDETKAISQDGSSTMYGQMTVDTTVQRLDARPVSQRKSIFMGTTEF